MWWLLVRLGGAKLAEAGDQAAHTAAGRFFRRMALWRPKAASDDYAGFVLGSVVLAEAGDEAAHTTAGRFQARAVAQNLEPARAGL
jgi:hypothetical protein